MTHVIISIEDEANGIVSVKALAHPVLAGGRPDPSPATELGDFLMKAVEVWQATHDMDLPDALAFVQSITTSLHVRDNSDSSAIH